MTALVRWLEERMGEALGGEESGVAEEAVVDEVLHELTIASRFKGWGDDDTGCVKEPVDQPDEEAEALRTAERLVYGWPSRHEDPTGAQSQGASCERSLWISRWGLLIFSRRGHARFRWKRGCSTCCGTGRGTSSEVCGGSVCSGRW